MAVTQLRRLAAFSPRSPDFGVMVMQVEFAVDEVTVGQVIIRVLRPSRDKYRSITAPYSIIQHLGNRKWAYGKSQFQGTLSKLHHKNKQKSMFISIIVVGLAVFSLV